MHNWNIYLSIFSSIIIIISFVHMYKNIQGKSYFDFFFLLQFAMTDTITKGFLLLQIFFN